MDSLLYPKVNQKKFNFLLSTKQNATEVAFLRDYLQNISTESLSMAKLATPIEEIYRFIRAYCVVVLDLKKVFGALGNRKAFERFVERYLRLGIADQFSFHAMVILFIYDFFSVFI